MYSDNIVPRNKFQQRFKANTEEHLAPDPFVQQEIVCQIIDVYDADRLKDKKLNVALASWLLSNPGKLYAKVQVKNGKEYILPFKDTPELIYSLYGNHVQLIDRPGKIHFNNLNIQNGTITVNTGLDLHLSLNSMAETFDIGGML